APPHHEDIDQYRLLRLAAGILAGLRYLHPGIGRHQAAFVRQRHELEAHVDGTHRALNARAVDAGIEIALSAFLDYLLVVLEERRFVAVELRNRARGEAEIRRADIDAV